MCNVLFPNLPPLPSEILYVLGNGFDIAHDVKSQYSDFKRWVKERGNQQLIRMMDTFFSNDMTFGLILKQHLENIARMRYWISACLPEE